MEDEVEWKHRFFFGMENELLIQQKKIYTKINKLNCFQKSTSTASMYFQAAFSHVNTLRTGDDDENDGQREKPSSVHLILCPYVQFQRGDNGKGEQRLQY